MHACGVPWYTHDVILLLEAAMSWIPCPDPVLGDETSVNSLEGLIIPRARDVDGMQVSRVLPVAKRRLVGPFIFFDRMGPNALDVGQGVDVRPHPHIGLSTVTYLLEGSLRHQDSLGEDRVIEPGAVNLMTAGKGIAHSERSTDEARQAPQRIFGIQSWLALPKDVEDMNPRFEHFDVTQLPTLQQEGVNLSVILGDFEGLHAPVKTWGCPFYVDVILNPGAALPYAPFAEERAIYVVEGQIEVDGFEVPANRMVIVRERAHATIRNRSGSPVRIMLLGGDLMDGKRHIWWNFVSSSQEKIEQAKEDWRSGQFKLIPGDAEEFVPLPGGLG